MNNFLWTTFTRSNPAVDVRGIGEFTDDKHWGCRGSLVIDARSKPHHAPPLVEDPQRRAASKSWRSAAGRCTVSSDSFKEFPIMRFLGLAILWLRCGPFCTSIGLVLTAMVLTTIAFLDFVHEFLFYGRPLRPEPWSRAIVVRRVYLLQENSDS